MSIFKHPHLLYEPIKIWNKNWKSKHNTKKLLLNFIQEFSTNKRGQIKINFYEMKDQLRFVECEI